MAGVCSTVQSILTQQSHGKNCMAVFDISWRMGTAGFLLTEFLALNIGSGADMGCIAWAARSQSSV